MSTEQQTRDPAPELDDRQIAEFLRAHPGFFEDHAELAAHLRIPHADRGESISLIEKQVEILRGQNRQLERRMVDLIEVARANEATIEKIHHLATAMLETGDLGEMLHALANSLRDRFGADAVAILLFAGDPRRLNTSPARRYMRDDAALEPLEHFLETGKPQCGRLRPNQLELLFGEQAGEIASAALIPLGTGASMGCLAVGSRNDAQFAPTLGTVYLERIGELVTAALTRRLTG